MGDVFDRLENTSDAIVTNEMAYFSLYALSKKLGHLHFVVTDAEGGLRGMIRLDELDLPADDVLRTLILIEDMLVEEVEPIRCEEDLHSALEKMLSSGFRQAARRRSERRAATVSGLSRIRRSAAHLRRGDGPGGAPGVAPTIVRPFRMFGLRLAGRVWR